MSRLTVEGCSVQYGEVTVVDRVDLDVPSGSMHALLGPSGSGKTTLLRAVAGFVRPTSGRIEIGGRDVSVLDPARRGVGVVFQSYALFPHLDVAGNVGFGLEMQGVGRQDRARRVRDILALVGLAGLDDRPVDRLSGGQQQRVALARALVIEPEILLLDEPMSALDRKIRADVQRELKRIHERTGVTAVIVTHDQEEALYLADAITILDDGRVRQVGGPREVYEHPGDPFIAGFLGRTNVIEVQVEHRAAGAIARLAGSELPVPMGSPAGRWRLSVRPERIAIGLRGAEGTLPAVVRQVDFTGPLASLDCELMDGSELVVSLWGWESHGYRRGAEVGLVIPPDAVTLYPEDDDAAAR
jgi:putative spermidine/putrescine transport system ATP-binding protein